MAHIRKIADGKYLIRVSRGTNKNRSYINKTFYGKLADAREKARELESAIDGNTLMSPGLTFEKYLDRWLAAVRPKLAPRTLDGYDGYIRRYALDKLGPVKLAEIRGYQIQDIYAGLDKLSPTTVRNLHAALRACFAYAVRNDILAKNPCKNIDLPRRRSPEIAVLSLDEAGEFAEACREMPNGLIFAFALETGMRPEEYLALRWRDLTITVPGRCEAVLQQAVQFNVKGGGYYFKELKTSRSRRRVPVSEDIRLRLITHRRTQNEQRLAMRGTWHNHDLVFPNTIGRPYPLNNLTRRYLAPILERCSLALTLYGLRHSCATILLMLGENPKVVADRLGSSVKMILETYTHVLPHIQTAATEKIANVMRMKG